MRLSPEQENNPASLPTIQMQEPSSKDGHFNTTASLDRMIEEALVWSALTGVIWKYEQKAETLRDCDGMTYLFKFECEKY